MCWWGREGEGLDKNSCETGRVVTYVVSFDNVQLQLVKGFYFEMVKCKKKMSTEVTFFFRMTMLGRNTTHVHRMDG